MTYNTIIGTLFFLTFLISFSVVGNQYSAYAQEDTGYVFTDKPTMPKGWEIRPQ